MAAPTSCAKKIRKPLPTPSRPHMAGGSASALSLSRPAQASHSLRPTGSLSRPRRPLSRGFSPASYPTKPLVSYRIYRHLSGWILPPLVIRAFRAHCQNRSSPRDCKSPRPRAASLYPTLRLSPCRPRRIRQSRKFSRLMCDLLSCCILQAASSVYQMSFRAHSRVVRSCVALRGDSHRPARGGKLEDDRVARFHVAHPGINLNDFALTFIAKAASLRFGDLQ